MMEMIICQVPTITRKVKACQPLGNRRPFYEDQLWGPDRTGQSAEGSNANQRRQVAGCGEIITTGNRPRPRYRGEAVGRRAEPGQAWGRVFIVKAANKIGQDLLWGLAQKKLGVEIQASADITAQINGVSLLVVIGKFAEKIKSKISMPKIDH
jgi:hypothetical protein